MVPSQLRIAKRVLETGLQSRAGIPSVLRLSIRLMAGATTEVEVRIVGARDLKNVNWKHGDLMPYVVLWVEDGGSRGDPIKISTKVDQDGDTVPKWNQSFTLVATGNLSGGRLMVEVVHHDIDGLIKKPEKAIVGRASLPLMEVADAGGFDETLDFTLKLKRPSGRPQGKLDIAIRLKEKRYAYTSPGQGYPGYGGGVGQSRDWGSAYPAPHPSPYGQTPGYSNPYPASSYGAPTPQNYGYGQPIPQNYGYEQPPSQNYGYGQPPTQSYGYGQPPYYQEGPPSSYSTQEPPKKGSKFGGVGTGLAIGALAGAVGGLALGEYVEHKEDEARDEQAEEDAERYAAQDDYGGDDYSFESERVQ